MTLPDFNTFVGILQHPPVLGRLAALQQASATLQTFAARLAAADPSSMRALLRLPLSLLPTFLVPLLIATHVWIFVRLARRS